MKGSEDTQKQSRYGTHPAVKPTVCAQLTRGLQSTGFVCYSMGRLLDDKNIEYDVQGDVQPILAVDVDDDRVGGAQLARRKSVRKLLQLFGKSRERLIAPNSFPAAVHHTLASTTRVKMPFVLDQHELNLYLSHACHNTNCPQMPPYCVRRVKKIVHKLSSLTCSV